MNRDLARRVRNVNGITQHKQVLRNDIKLSAKLIHALDERERLWSHKHRGEALPVEVQDTHSNRASLQLLSILIISKRTQKMTCDCELFFCQLPAQNPILKNITDYLIEEVSAEEEELLGSMGGADSEEGTKEGNPAEITVERDDKLVKVCSFIDSHTQRFIHVLS